MSDPAKAMKLLPCPFCGGVAIRMKHANGCKQIRCKACKAATAFFVEGDDWQRIEAKWNMRATVVVESYEEPDNGVGV
jgi:transcription elongation factor Elf1